MKLANSALNISESLTLAISARAKEMKAEGKDVIGFGAGEPDFDTPEYIKEAAREALEKGLTGYTAVSGTPELKEAISDKLKRDNNLDYDPSRIIVSNGAKHCLYNTFQVILNPGDEVIIPVPYWVSYPEMVKMGGGKPVFVETGERNSFKLRPAALEKNVTSRTKALILNSPGNPTGSVYSKKELEEIAELAVEQEFFVIADEVYEKLIYDDREHFSIASLGPEIKKLTVVINGLSKAYAMTGWRIGFAAARTSIVELMNNIQSHSTSNPNSIAQYAGVKALRGGGEEINRMAEEYDKRRKYMIERINSIRRLSCVRPRGAFYVMVNIGEVIGASRGENKIDGSLSFAEHLLERERVAVVPGIAFGADNYVRLSYATGLEQIKKGLTRLESFIKEFFK